MSSKCTDVARELESLLPATTLALFPSATNGLLSALTLPQMRLFRQVHGGVSTVGELAKRLRMTPSAVTQLVNRLETAGYLERTEDSVDRRVRRLSLTDLAKRSMLERQELRVAHAIKVISHVSPEDQAALVRVLHRIVAAQSELQENGFDEEALTR